MDKLNEAVSMMLAKLREEEGDDFKLDDGDEVVAVFNDGVIFVSKDASDVNVKIVLGEPMKFDFDLDMLEKKVIEED